MNALQELFQIDTLTKTEEDQIIEIFTNPLVKKYLKIMGRNDLKELATISVTEREDSEVGKKHALVQGKLAVIATLLSIQKP
jgi:ethanolamine utilization protein EutP (predicted NTPase)